MGHGIEHVTIVGGGSSGWFAAALMIGGRNRRNDGPDLKVSLIESPRIPTVGVGEATTLSIAGTLQLLSIDEKDFLKSCDASFKSAVKFVNWDRAPDGSPASYYHPFEQPRYLFGYQPAYHYHRRARRGAALPPLAEAMIPYTALLDADKSPRLPEASDFEGLAPYAYHVDAGLLGAYLQTFCETMGVDHIRDDVLDAELDERGFVRALSLRGRGRFPVEFVIDCSGFQGLIIRKILGEPFIDYTDSLPCDRAIALQVPYEGDDRIPPYTTATGLDSGWSWQVPLYSRRGVGYVYSSRHSSDEAALAELRAQAGPAGAGVDPNMIRMRIGRAARSWVGNCVAVGLAGGFIEPLESTSIHFVQMSIRWLLDNFPDKACSPPLRDRYNGLVKFLYEDIRDFIAMHYATSNRDDTAFWRFARNELAVPEALASQLPLWRHKLPSAPDTPNRISLFSEWSYIFVLYGKRFFEDIDFPQDDTIGDDDFDAWLKDLQDRRARLMTTAIDHRAALTQIRAAPTEPWYRPPGEPIPAATTAALA